jgi:hypothetical protein
MTVAGAPVAATLVLRASAGTDAGAASGRDALDAAAEAGDAGGAAARPEDAAAAAPDGGAADGGAGGSGPDAAMPRTAVEAAPRPPAVAPRTARLLGQVRAMGGHEAIPDALLAAGGAELGTTRSYRSVLPSIGARAEF